eukprot:TRINITY_DN76297_c0_g1_i1.p1 TRINITY_DN76297_c0_g1~~TRINITY_DN76297_c0_g1_i1.p1  ORF type:complete len:846 (+),score=99.59 TRINITY_DN76297_c0_g1_i1:57-2540(+)
MVAARDLLAVFQRFDTDGDGTISFDELKAILCKLGSEWNDESCQSLFDAIDMDQDGFIQYGEFVTWVFGNDDGAETICQQFDLTSVSGLNALHASLAESLVNGIVNDPSLTDDAIHLLLQWQLLEYLGHNRTKVAGAMLGELLNSKAMLEILLSSGECGPQLSSEPLRRTTSPEVVSDRWCNVITLLSQILAADPAARGISWRFRLAVAISLTFCHSKPLTRMATGEPIDPLDRYRDFSAFAESGAFHASFLDQSAWAMRYVAGSWCASDELVWARENVDADTADRESLANATHRMIRYRTENDDGESVHGPNFYGGRHVTLEEMHKTGGVCGVVSKFAAGVCQAFGIPCMPIGQPGHCAYIWQLESGSWKIGNACNPWSLSTRHEMIQISWGNWAWMVPLMAKAQSDFMAFSRSERLRALSVLAKNRDGAGSITRAELLHLATEACPSNFAALLDRVESLKDAMSSNVDPDEAPWVTLKWKELCDAESEQGDVVVSRRRPVRASEEDRKSNIVDCTDSEWWTSSETAWFEIDLGQVCTVNQVRLKWWGCSTSDAFKLLSSEDGAEFIEQRTQADGSGISEPYNGWTDLPGWDAPTKCVRVELAEGHLDPWGQGKLFGIRQVLVMGQPNLPFQDRLPCKAADVLKALVATMPIDGPLEAEHKECAIQLIHEKVDDIKLELAEVLSHAKPVRSSEPDRAQNVTDGTNSEWWTSEPTAWLEIDLGHPSYVWEVSVQWWGCSLSDNFKVSSSLDGDEFIENRTQADASSVSDAYNGWTSVPGWDEPTTCVRLELADGNLDPWGHGKLFGIRQVLIKGERATHYKDGVRLE